MATFVLVHGAWGGAHTFRHVRPILQDSGHRVFTPSLTGIGERVHLASPLVNLSTHVRDLVNQVLYEDLKNITLVGFSYGGFVVTGALEHIADRIDHLVYLDAFVPDSGETLSGHVRGGGRVRIELGDEWLVSGPAREYDDPEERQWMQARRTAHPRACFNEPVYLSQPLEAFSFTRTYIKATAAAEGDPGEAAFRKAARRADKSPAWTYLEIASNHMAAINLPAATAALLAGVATGN
jgi:pimeloyl-ACP methyl ester carboxylesterase